MSGVEATMSKARNAEKRGDFPEAERLYSGILQRFPRNARARAGLDQLAASRAAATLRAGAPPQPALDHLAAIYRQGKLAQAVTEAEALLAQYPRSALVHNLLAAAWLGLGRPERAEEGLRRAMAQDLRHPALSNNMGMALAGLGRLEEAMEAYREAIELNPRHAAARGNLANALKARGRLDEALDAYEAALAIEPDNADVLNNQGLLLAALGRPDDAEAAYRRAMELRGDHAAARNNLGVLLAERGDLAGAVALYEAALAIDGSHADAHFNLGNAHKRQGRLVEAGLCYERSRAARSGNGSDTAEVWNEEGKALAMAGRLDEAISAFGGALSADPGHSGARMHGLFYRAHACDWSAFAEFAALDDVAPGGISPFALLTFEDDPARQLRRSAAWARETLRSRPAPLPAPMPARAASGDDRIGIGYFSADFHDHATMHLIAGLLREHDRARFAIHAFGFGRASDDAMRGHLLDHVDSFTDIREMPDAAVAELARERGIGIAVDLKGYTQGARAQLFAHRLAPVQIAYLGYPGSMGADFMDYMIADRVVIPPEERAHYSEKLLLLPGSYQVNDDRGSIADMRTARADFGLTEDGFVFCCFNQSYKITPREFAIWMRLLQAVEGSVLWLLRANPLAEANLRREAEERGVAPERLVFSDPLPHAEHLARHCNADLFLDTFNVNAHTTASDALWAGLPVVTLAGRQFAARVAASLLDAVGLPELIAHGEAEYEALCLDLATAPDKLAAIRARLAGNRGSAPLFDTVRSTRAIEAGYAAAWQRHLAGHAPEDILIPDIAKG